jgi:Ca2+-binding EF-hand superfamily protein
MDRTDFCKCLGLLGSSKTKGVFSNRLFDVFSGGSKRMSFDQFVACMGSMVHGDQDEKLRLVFNMCATHSSNHSITKDELRSILEALHELFDLGGRSALNKSLNLKQTVIDSIFDQLDVNHDGVVEWHEFHNVVKKNPDILLRVEGDVTLPGQRLVDSIALATKIESMIDSLRKRPKQEVSPTRKEESPLSEPRDFKLLVSFRTKKIRCDVTNVTSVSKLYSLLEKKLDVSCISELYVLDDEDNELKLKSLEKIPEKCKMRAVEGKLKKVERESTDQVLKRAHVLMLRLVLSLQQLRVDVGEQLEIEENSQNSPSLIPPTPKEGADEPSTQQLDKETKRLKEVRKIMNASGQLLSQLSADSTEPDGDMQGHKKNATSITSHQSKEDFDKIMPGDSRWNKVLTVMKGIQLGAARSQGEANTKLRKFDFFTKDEYRLESFTSSSSSSNDVCTFQDFAPRIFYALRRKWGISTNDYIGSVGYESMYRKLFYGSLEAFSGAPTKAAGGGFFYFSADEKYLIKSLDENEFRAFFVDLNDSGHTFLQDYYNRIVSAIDSNQPSLLCQFCGLHKLTSQLDDGESYLVVMRNVLVENRDDQALPYVLLILEGFSLFLSLSFPLSLSLSLHPHLSTHTHKHNTDTKYPVEYLISRDH